MAQLRFNYGHIALPALPTASRDDCDTPDGSSTAPTDAFSERAVQVKSASIFERAESVPPDPILGMRDAFLADAETNKLNLAVGVYRTAENKPLVLECVQEAEAELLAAQKAGKTFKEYLPPDGMAAFCAASLKLLLGDAIAPALDEGRVASAQSLSGTGGLHLAARMLKEVMPEATVHLPAPTWPIHPDIFTAVGLKVASYPYYDADTCGFDAEAMLAHLASLPPRSVVLFHACAHNPTGVDPTAAQWAQIAAVVEQRALVPLIDSAYQGLASGDLEADAHGMARSNVHRVHVCTRASG